jgi:hypothetical protein
MMGFVMAIVAPKERKHLSADALFRLMQSGFASLPAYRPGDTELSLTDALMSACARFSLTSPSLLAFDKQRAEGNLQTIYGIACVPGETRMRERLDPLSPESLRPLCKSVFRHLPRGQVLAPRACLDDYSCVALDGPEYFSSQTIHGASCLHQVHRHGASTYSHQLVGAARIHPDMRAVIPLLPAPMVQQDGTAKNDCDRKAAKRFLVKLRQDHPHRKCVITEDSLRAHAPHSETLPAPGLHSILGVKAGEHA